MRNGGTVRNRCIAVAREIDHAICRQRTYYMRQERADFGGPTGGPGTDAHDPSVDARAGVRPSAARGPRPGKARCAPSPGPWLLLRGTCRARPVGLASDDRGRCGRDCDGDLRRSCPRSHRSDGSPSPGGAAAGDGRGDGGGSRIHQGKTRTHEKQSPPCGRSASRPFSSISLNASACAPLSPGSGREW